MAAPKGYRPPNAGKGRVKGVPNKATAEAKGAIEDAFAHLQADPEKNLRAWAEQNTDQFYMHLFPKLLPLQVNHAGQVSVSYEVVSPVRAIDVTEWQAQIPHRPN